MAWLAQLDLPDGRYHTHQARHTLATNLLRCGASLEHIRRFLGHMSQAMTERYTQLAPEELLKALREVWVHAPGVPHVEQQPLRIRRVVEASEAQRLRTELSYATLPVAGGMCSADVVVDGARCPRALDCQGCDDFIITGLDYSYWRTKVEFAYAEIETLNDDAVRAYLLSRWRPMRRALDGLVGALDALGLLEAAGHLQPHPRTYLQPLARTGFRFVDLIDLGEPSIDVTSEEQP